MAGLVKSLLKQRILRHFAAALFTIFILALLWENISYEVFSDVFSRLSVENAIMALLVYAGMTSVRALRFQAVGARLSFSSAFRITAIHSALLRVMPFRSGELVYAMLLKREGGGGYTLGVASIILVRILDLAATLPLAAVALSFLVTDADTTVAMVLLSLLGLAFVFLFFGLKRVFRGLEARLAGGPEESLRARLAELCHTVVETYDLPLKRRLWLIVLTAALWALVILLFCFSLAALGAIPDFTEGFVVSIMGITGSILPLALIGNFGPLEGGLALGLTTIGQSNEMALASALLVSALTLICGWVLAIPSGVAILLGKRSENQGESIRSARVKATFRRNLGALLFSSLGALLLLLKYPYGFESNDQFQYLLLPYRHIYHDFLIGDWFTWEVSHYHVTFSWIIRGLHALLGESGFPVGVFAMHVVVLMSLCYGLLALARALGFHWPAAAIAVLLVAFVNHLGIGGAIVTHGILLPADMALPPFLLGSASWVAGRRFRAGLFLGLAGFLHANFAMLGPMVFAVPELLRIVRTRKVKETLWLALGFVALAWPTLIAAATAFLASDAAPEALDILFKIRSPHHYNPEVFSLKETWWIIALLAAGLPVWMSRSSGREQHRGLVLLIALAACQALALAGTVLDVAGLVRLFLWRLSIPLMLLAALSAGESWIRAVVSKKPFELLTALTALAVVLSFSANGLIRFSFAGELAGYGVVMWAMVPLAAIPFLKRFWEGRTCRLVSAGLGVAAFAWVALASLPGLAFEKGRAVDWSVAVKKWQTFHDIGEKRIMGNVRAKRLYRWIREHTPRNARFLIPPGTDDFRLGARRAVFVDWKCCPMKGEEVLEWKRRMLAAMGTERFPAKGYALHRVANRRFNARRLERLAKLAKNEGVTHLLVRGKPGAVPESLEALTTQNGYTVLGLAW